MGDEGSEEYDGGYESADLDYAGQVLANLPSDDARLPICGFVVERTNADNRFWWVLDDQVIVDELNPSAFRSARDLLEHLRSLREVRGPSETVEKPEMTGEQGRRGFQ